MEVNMELKHIDTILFDLNGTLYEKGIAVEGANDTIKKLRTKGYNLNFITNTDGRSIEDVYKSVVKKGLNIEFQELFTPVSAVKSFIKENRDKKFYPLVNDFVLKDLNYDNVIKYNADYVIIGDFCDKVSYNEINKVFRMIKHGAEIIALSKTLWYIDVDDYSINTGAFVKMFEIACDKEAILMGKPSEKYFNMALKRTNSKPENTIIIGDDINTDIFGANKLNVTSVLVKTGIFDEKILKESIIKPDFIIDNVNGLRELLNL